MSDNIKYAEIETKFTKGDWRVVEEPDDDGPDIVFTVVDEASPILGVCSIQNYMRGEYHESKANADLIAASPKLLKALAWYVDNDETNEGQTGNEYFDEGRNFARQALRDALGI